MRLTRQPHIGFSYAEFLIVAAAILVLGAVALPRYRQADTASDYARVLNNFSEFEVALEAYRTDRGGYPETDQGLSAFLNGRRSIFRLTTPVAYMPSLPLSPFAENFGSTDPGLASLVNTAYYRQKLRNDGSVDSTFAADVTAFAFQGQASAAQPGFVTESRWELRSAGPDSLDDRGHFSQGGYGVGARIYDPTNGTTSRGDIVWFSNAKLSQLPTPTPLPTETPGPTETPAPTPTESPVPTVAPTETPKPHPDSWMYL